MKNKYYCYLCNKWHNINSDIGKLHGDIDYHHKLKQRD